MLVSLNVYGTATPNTIGTDRSLVTTPDATIQKPPGISYILSQDRGSTSLFNCVARLIKVIYFIDLLLITYY